MTEVNTSAAPVSTEGAAPAKKIQAFYTGKDAKGTAVSLWVTEKTKAGSPDFDGTIGERRVAGYLQQGPKAGFISFIDSKLPKDAEGHYVQVATANVVVNVAGIPKLVITPAGTKEDADKIWADVSLKLSVETQVQAGLNLEIQAQKKAAHAANKAAAATQEPVTA